jgi:general secretion pathway protein E
MDTTCVRPEPRCAVYRDALLELAERYGSGIRALEALPAHVDADADTVLARLAGEFRLTPIAIRDMHQLEPDFGVMPFVEAAARLCLCFRDGPGLLIVMPIRSTRARAAASTSACVRARRCRTGGRSRASAT